MTTTIEQKRFRVIKASAGSGKTFRLGVEFLKLILEQEEASYFKQILGITFTNKAANELKERVLVFLKALYLGDNQDLQNIVMEQTALSEQVLKERAKKCYEAILVDYGEFSIMTIDKFVQRIVRGFSRELGLQSGFEVSLNEEEMWAEVIETWVMGYGSNTQSDDEKLNRFAVENYKEKSKWDVQHGLIHFAKSVLGRKSVLKVTDQILDQYSEWQKELSTIQAKCTSLVKQLKSLGFSDVDFKYKAQGFLANIEKIGSGEFDRFVAKRFPALLESFPEGILGKECDRESELVMLPEMQQFLEFARGLDREDVYLKSLFVAKKSMLVLAGRLTELFNMFCEDQNQQPISTFKERVNKVVENEPVPFIYERIGNRFKHFFIDEFQDTSPKEFENFIPLIENGMGEGKSSYLVGDAKQSIYRFKGGDADQFVGLPKFSERITSEVMKEREATFGIHFHPDNTLDTNWRSSEKVVEFNNNLFSKENVRRYRMPIKSGVIAAISEKMVEAYDKSEQKWKAEGGYVSVTKRSQEELEQEPWEWTRKTIEELVKEGIPHSEISVLVRTNKDSQELVEYLLEKKLAVRSSNAITIGISKAVGVLVAALRYMVNDNTLDQFKMHYYLLDYKQNEVSLSEVIAKIDAGAIKLEEYLEDSISFIQLIQKLIRVLDIEISDLFVQYFLSMVQDFERIFGFDIPLFLKKWDKELMSSNVEVNERQESIEVLTMHKSKGLEFGTVLLPQVGKMGKGGEAPLVSFDYQGTPVLTPVNKLEGTKLEHLYTQENEAKAMDFINLLYVGCTRAANNLLLEVNDNEIGEWVCQSAEGLGLKLLQENHWTWGTLKKNQKDEDTDISGGISSCLTQGGAKVVVASKLRDDVQDQRIFGSELHDVLSGIVEPSDLELSIERRKWVSSKEDLLKGAQDVLAMGDELGWFQAGVSVYNERDFWVSGELLRPDRVMDFGDHVVVVDYKSGEQSAKHEEQVQGYVRLIEALFKKPTKGILLYTNIMKVKEV